MTFSNLKDFLMNRMRMSQIYQPVMLINLLKNGGVVSIESIAKDLLINDQSQLEHYDDITKNMVGKVLIKNNVVKKEGNSFNLLDYDSYSEKKQQEIETLIGNLAGIIDEVVQTDKSNQDYIKETLNHPVLSASEASAADIKATYDVSNHQKSVLGRQYVDRKN